MVSTAMWHWEQCSLKVILSLTYICKSIVADYGDFDPNFQKFDWLRPWSLKLQWLFPNECGSQVCHLLQHLEIWKHIKEHEVQVLVCVFYVWLWDGIQWRDDSNSIVSNAILHCIIVGWHGCEKPMSTLPCAQLEFGHMGISAWCIGWSIWQCMKWWYLNEVFSSLFCRINWNSSPTLKVQTHTWFALQ
jgi:hypothetical protein